MNVIELKTRDKYVGGVQIKGKEATWLDLLYHLDSLSVIAADDPELNELLDGINTYLMGYELEIGMQ